MPSHSFRVSHLQIPPSKRLDSLVIHRSSSFTRPLGTFTCTLVEQVRPELIVDACLVRIEAVLRLEVAVAEVVAVA